MRTTVFKLEIAISVFENLAAGFNQNIHGIDEKKIDTHVGYCKHLLGIAKVYKEAAELEEQQSRQKQELARQVTLAEEASRKAEEQKKLQMERRKQEEELKRVREMEARFERVKYIHGISNKTYPQELIDDLRDMWVKYFFQQIEDRH